MSKTLNKGLADFVSPSEVIFSVNGLDIHGLRWRTKTNEDRIPVLCLHGWLDNAASFSRVAPRLLQQQPLLDLVAIDTAGNGLSSHRSDDASYNIWEDIEEVLGVADELGWERFHVLAHSKGGMVSILMSSAMPERVISQFLLDAFLFMPKKIPFPQQLRKYLRDRQAYTNRRLQPYASIDDAAAKRMQNTKLTLSEIRPIVERDLTKSDKGFVWRHDVRLRGASAVRISSENRLEILEALKTPTKVILAKKGEVINMIKKISDQVNKHKAISTVEHEGDHHFHLEEAHFSSIADHMLEWLAEHT